MKNTDKNESVTKDDNALQQSRIRKLEESERRYKKKIAALRNSENIYKTIFENTGTITLIFDEKTTITMVNSDFAQRMGYSKEEVEGKRSWTEFIAKDDLDRLIEYHNLRSVDPGSAPRHHEFKVINKSGEILHIYMTIDVIPGTKLRIASLIDITDRIRAEEEIMKISETERQKIGQDLHDDLAPHLIGIEVLTKLLVDKLEKNSPSDVGAIKKIRELILDAITKTRGFAHGLCPVFLVEHGLESALHELTSNINEIYGIRCSFICDNPVIEYDIATSTHLYYIAQEAAHNAVKHGRAKNIKINLSIDNNIMRLSIQDDGTGFNEEKSITGTGQKIMKYRAARIGAYLMVHSTRGAGTKVMVTMPARVNG